MGKEKKGKGKGKGKGREEEEKQGKQRGEGWPELRLVEEVGLDELLGGELEGRCEASGVYYRDERFHVVFDDVPHLARIGRRLGGARAGSHELIRQRGEGGFEDLTFDPVARRWYLLIESAPRKGTLYPRVEEYSEDFRYLGARWLDYELEEENKGLEGLAYVRVGKRDGLLGMCEGNHGKGGKKGREAGNGRIQLFLRGADGEWTHEAELALPPTVLFEDYAALDLSEGRITVLSQSSSAVWIGELRSVRAADAFAGEGTIWAFPRDDRGRPIYPTVEGLTWVGPQELAVVTDRGDGEEGCRDRAIHVFRVPG